MSNSSRRIKSSPEQLFKLLSLRDVDPFIIIHQHRKAKKLKKMRQLRRKKIQANKQLDKIMTQAKRREAVYEMNRSMLLDEQNWDNVKVMMVSDS